jgi:hypothetical protein
MEKLTQVKAIKGIGAGCDEEGCEGDRRSSGLESREGC